ncbi:sigma-70 family RNA polymerase sigma factor [Tolypothrix sp. PCC 7601]|uniref:sigma-70 family RNA polymerase sigma factor n=1 Tax=Tolypothrix sp. PCC 7601 TaxID=1188 RepID=UPI0021E0A768|nr:sigma-70 family RNA polymerase sigma factor [Tolypothrix sp. PCC 7601]
MNEQQLQELALQAQQHPLGTTARRITLSKLIDGIYCSGKLCHPYNGQFQGVYEQIYQEAVQDLFLYICKNIDKYDPERALFMTWVNMLLSQRFFKEAIPKIIGKVHEINVESSVLENLEYLVFNDSENEDNYIFAFKKIRRYIEIDPKGDF